MFKETTIDGELISSRDRDFLCDLVNEYLLDNVKGYSLGSDFEFEIKVEYWEDE